jgi:hypothetical protein
VELNLELTDPNDPRKKGVLQRWYKAVSPLLKSYYGGDLNVDEIHEVIPMTEECLASAEGVLMVILNLLKQIKLTE